MRDKTRIKLKAEIPITELAQLSGAPLTGDRPPLRYISTDSRLCQRGDLFISLAKDKAASAEHIKEARERGALTLGIGAQISASPIQTLLTIARREKNKLTSLKRTIAVTGSVGKTTTKEFLRTILSVRYRCHATHGNNNNDIGLPLTLLCAPEDTEVLILECGMNHRGEISKLSRCAEPDIAVITNIGTAHIGMLGSREEIAAAKLEILDGMPKDGTLVCEVEEPLLVCNAHRRTFSATDSRADCFITRGKDGAEVIEDGIHRMHLPYSGPKHLMHNLAAAVTVARIMGLTEEEILGGVKMIGEAEMRHKLLKRDGYSILSDAYNASYESICAALSLLMETPAPIHSALLGDILELGSYAAEIHSKVGAYAAKVGLDKLYPIGKHAQYTAEGAMEGGMPKEKIFVPEADNLAEIARIIKGKLQHGECILIKGSNACGLWRIPDLLDGEDDDRY